MIDVSSRQPTVRQDIPVFATSESRESHWGQPPVSQYVFELVGNRLFGQPIAGIYLRSPMETLEHHSCLREEFGAWDALSDEALALFEAALE